MGKRPSYDRICSYCGNQFEAHDKRKIFCSKRCSTNASKVRRGIEPTITHKKICLGCGKEFETQYSRKMYCKKGCKGNNTIPNQNKITLSSRIEEHQPNFVFLSRTNKGRVLLKCKNCGNVIERASSTVRRKNVICEYCKEQEKLEEARINVINALIAVRESKTPKICKTCNKEFYSVYPTKLYCSNKCKKKKGGNHKRRAKKYGVEYENGITLQRVIKRDNNICQICGEVCDNTDKRWGTFGPMHPTIDHIVPLAKGGAHKWSNIHLAHGICNSYKRDLIND